MVLQWLILTQHIINSYLWTDTSGVNLSTSNFLTNVCYNMYFVYITDSSGCTTIDTLNLELVNGCTDILALNYNPSANVDDGSCDYCDLSLLNITRSSCDSLLNDASIRVSINTNIANSLYSYNLEQFDNGSWLSINSLTSFDDTVTFSNLPSDTFRVIING